MPRGAVKRPAGADFIMQSNKTPVKPVRFPKLAEELKKQEKDRVNLDVQAEVTGGFADTIPSNLVAYLESG